MEDKEYCPFEDKTFMDQMESEIDGLFDVLPDDWTEDEDLDGEEDE